jgi:hypothetical protein
MDGKLVVEDEKSNWEKLIPSIKEYNFVERKGSRREMFIVELMEMDKVHSQAFLKI